MPGDKAVNLLRVLDRQQRAGHVEQAPTGGKQRPQGIQYRGLPTNQRIDVVGPPQKADIRMATHDPGGRTGCIDQDPLVTPCAPAGGVGRRSIRGHQLGMQSRARQVVGNALQARRFDVQRRDRQVFGALQDVQRLSARRGTGIQHGLTGMQIEVGAGQLRTGILYRHLATREAGQPFDRNRPVEHQRGRHLRVRTCGYPGLGKTRGVVGEGCLTQVDPQRHRRAFLQRRQDRGGLYRPGVVDGTEQPVRLCMAQRLVGVDVRLQRFALTQQPAQHPVDQSARPALAQGAAGLHRGRYRGVRRHAAVQQLIGGDQQQHVQIAVAGLEPLLQQPADQGIEAPVPATDPIAEFGTERPVTIVVDRWRRREDVVQRTTVENREQVAHGSEAWVRHGRPR